MMETVGTRIKAFRDSRGLTQKDIFVATKEEVKQTSLSAIEKGVSKPGYETLAALFLAYPNLNPDWLLLGTGPMLRDGRVLTPAPPTTAPTPGLTSGAATVAEAENVLLRELLTSKNTVIELLRSEVTELRGKSPDSLDAAGPLATYPPKPHVPVTGFQLAVQRRARGAAQTSR